MGVLRILFFGVGEGDLVYFTEKLCILPSAYGQQNRRSLGIGRKRRNEGAKREERARFDHRLRAAALTTELSWLRWKKKRVAKFCFAKIQVVAAKFNG